MSVSVAESDVLRAPFPWFGGKRRVADIVWDRFGDVSSFNEPFAGSLAVLLARPTPARVETINDLDAYVANFWRALSRDPDAVAYWADSPVNETDLHARHRWLVQSVKARSIMARVKADPDFFSAKIAGWWVWGQCLWIGSGWCDKPEWSGRDFAGRRSRGLTTKRFAGTGNGQGCGVHRRWQGGGKGGGSGVHAPKLSQQLPALNGDAGATGHGILASAFDARTGGLYAYMQRLAERLRRVRVCCGDWKRVLTPSVTSYIGVTGVFLDPPYDHDLRERCYAQDHNVSVEVREWALEHGDDEDLRIALCGYEDEHGAHMPSSWECVKWKAHGGYSRSERGVENRAQERIWFSPHCLQPEGRLPFEVIQ